MEAESKWYFPGPRGSGKQREASKTAHFSYKMNKF